MKTTQPNPTMATTSCYVAPLLAGTWILDAIFRCHRNGLRNNLYGNQPCGILMYTPEGFVNAQIGYSCHEIPLTVTDTRAHSDPLAETYLAYYGRYTEEEPGKIVHRVHGCSNLTWWGTEQIRYASFQDRKLCLRTPEMQVRGIKSTIEVLWVRAGEGSYLSEPD